jgi:hypothetical protein
LFWGQDLPISKLYYLSFCLSLFKLKTMLVEKTVIAQLGESQSCIMLLWPAYVGAYLNKAGARFIQDLAAYS